MVTFIITLLKWSFIVLLSLLCVGFLFEQYCRWKLEKRAFAGKTFADINGKALHYVKKGHGNCTVVFVSGMGSSHRIWKEIQDSLSQHAVTLAYDRNGIMWSEAAGMPVTNHQVSEELQLLLEKTKCPRPYILVAHSMAGIYLRPFIKWNEKDISGIVFAEAAHPQQVSRYSPELLKALSVPPGWLVKFVVRTGIYRTVFSFFPSSPEIPLNHPLHQLEKDFFYRSCDKVLEELAHDQMNFKDAEQYTSFGDIMLTVITGTSARRYAAIKNTAVQNEYRSLINELQHDLLKLSTRSQWVPAQNSGHILQIYDVALLVDEIRKMPALKNDDIR